jgi:hypothetical protein
MFISFLMGYCVDDESQDYEVVLEKLFSQLPPEIPNVLSSYFWALSRGYLVRAMRAVIWNRPEDAARYFDKAAEMKFEIDEEFIQQATHELLGFELCYGAEAMPAVLSKLSTGLEKIGGRRQADWIKGSYLMNKAGRAYANGKRGTASGTVLGAIASHPKYLFDRGVLAILAKSMVGVKPAPSG